MTYISRNDIMGYYFKNENIFELLDEIGNFFKNGRNEILQDGTDGISIEWNNQISQYIASIYIRENYK